MMNPLLGDYDTDVSVLHNTGDQSRNVLPPHRALNSREATSRGADRDLADLRQALHNTLGFRETSLYGWRDENVSAFDAPTAPGGTAVNALSSGSSVAAMYQRRVFAKYADPQGALNTSMIRDPSLAPSAIFASSQQARMVDPFYAILDQFSPYLYAVHVDAFKRQLQSLLDDEEELKAERINPSHDSFGGLISFMVSAPGLNHPNLSMTRSGEFNASWTSGAQRKIAITFENRVWARWSAVDRAAHVRDSGRLRLTKLGSVPAGFGDWMRS